MMEGVKEEGRAHRERNEGGEADMWRAWSEGVKEEGRAGRGEIKEGKQVCGEHGVRW